VSDLNFDLGWKRVEISVRLRCLNIFALKFRSRQKISDLFDEIFLVTKKANTTNGKIKLYKTAYFHFLVVIVVSLFIVSAIVADHPYQPPTTSIIINMHSEFNTNYFTSGV